MKTRLCIALVTMLAALSGCASAIQETTCDSPRIQRELSYTPPGCAQDL